MKGKLFVSAAILSLLLSGMVTAVGGKASYGVEDEVIVNDSNHTTSSVLTYPTQTDKPVHNVDQDTNHSTIQKGIDNATAGDTLLCENHTYNENIIVDKNLTIKGKSRTNTTIDGGGSGDVVTVNAAGVNITRFKITNGRAGITASSETLENSLNLTVYKTNITGNELGIYYWKEGASEDHTTVKDNLITQNEEAGIWLTSGIRWDIIGNRITDQTNMNEICSNINISDNILRGELRIGQDSDHVTVRQNRIYGRLNLRGSSNCLIENNMINNSSDGIDISNSNNNRFINNTVQSDNRGVNINGGGNNVFTQCTINGSNYGLYAKDYSDPTVFNSTIETLSSGKAVSVSGSSSTTLVNCTFNKSSTSVGSDSTLYVDWYMHLKVEDTSGSGMAGADVMIEDNTGSLVVSDTTNQYGWINWSRRTEFEESGETRVYRTPHNISAYAGDKAGYTDPYMAKSKSVLVVLNRSRPKVDDMRIEREPGEGDLNGTQFLINNDFTLYASAYNSTFDYLYPANVTWSVNNSVATVDAGPATETTLTTEGKGPCRISIENTTYPNNSSDIEVFAPVYNVDQGTNHSTIQKGIDNATAGDTLLCENYTYYENINVDKNLTIKGESRTNTTIDGGESGDVVTIDAHGVNITGFRIRNGGQAGIMAYETWEYSLNLTVYKTNITGNGVGIYYENEEPGEDNTTVKDNIIKENADYGIQIFGGAKWDIVGNKITDITELDYSSDINISGNIFRGELKVGYRHGSDHVTVRENMIESRLSLSGSSSCLVEDNMINSSKEGIDMTKSNNNRFINNTVQSDSKGANINGGGGNVFRQSSINGSDYGVDTLDTSDLVIYNSSIKTSSTGTAVGMVESSSARLVNCTFNKSSTSVDSGSTLYVDWYLHVRVENTSGSAVDGADVRIEDNSNNLVTSDTTDQYGWMNWTQVTEFEESGGTKNYRTSHNISVYAEDKAGYADPYMDESKSVLVVLNRPRPQVDDIKIERERGKGDINGTQFLINIDFTLYASAYNSTLGYLYPANVTWSTNNSVATVDAGPATETILSTEEKGSSSIIIDNNTYPDNSSDVDVFAPVYNVNQDAYNGTIQDGINYAAAGDTLLCENYTYDENIKVDKSLTIIGENRTNTTIDGGGSGDVVTVNAAGVNITGFKIKNGEVGITGPEMLENSLNLTVYKTNITGNAVGIYYNKEGSGEANTTIKDNVITQNTQYGIRIIGGTRFDIISNRINDKTWLESSCSYINISDNILRDELELGREFGPNNVTVRGNRIESKLSLSDSSSCLIEDNTINGFEEGIYLYNSNNNLFINNTVQSANTGVKMIGSDDNVFRQSSINGSDHGIYARDSSNSTVYNSTIESSSTGTTVNVDESAVLRLINCTFDNSSTSVGSESTLYVDWYMHVKVEDAGGAPAEDADVIIKDNSSSIVASNTTDQNGWLNWTQVTEFEESGGTRNYHTPHNISVSFGDKADYTDVYMNESKSIIMSFEEVVRYNLTIHIEGEGSTDPAEGNHTYEEGKDVTVKATPSYGWGFGEWTGDATGTDSTIDLTMDANKSITAHFERLSEYELIINIEGNGSTIPTEGSHTYYDGEEISVEATPAEGWKFGEWTGDATGTDSTIDIKMNSNKSITAHFRELDEYNLTINIEGQGSTDPAEGNHTYEEGNVVTVKAMPADGWKFDQWTGDVTGTNLTTNITMNGDKSITAKFEEVIEYNLTLNIEGDGTVEVEGSKVEDGWTDMFEEGSNVTLRAISDKNWTFKEWTGNFTGSEEEVTIKMDEDKSITAHFAELKAEFEVTNFTVDPIEGEAPLNVTITADVKNVGNTEGTIELTVKGEEFGNVTLEPGENKTLVKNYEFEEKGEHTITFGDQSRSVNVEEEEERNEGGGLSMMMTIGIILLILIVLAIIGYMRYRSEETVSMEEEEGEISRGPEETEEFPEDEPEEEV